MKQLLVVGFGGKRRHGKGFAARLLRRMVIRETDADAIPLSFATDLKGLARCLGMREKNGPVLQALGTDVVRAVAPDAWVDKVDIQLTDLQLDLRPEDRLVVVFDDVRFPNEIALIRKWGGIVNKVLRLNEDGTLFQALDGRNPNHASETELDRLPDTAFDVVIRAKSGNLEALDTGVRAVMQGVRTWLDPSAAYPDFERYDTVGPWRCGGLLDTPNPERIRKNA